ncbi:MAG: hypothetical protein SGPRY_005217, partial [Prymnesium sp.]
ELFELCDYNRSGDISLPEFMELFDKHAVNAHTLASIKFNQADSIQKDAKLSVEEFVAYFLKYFDSYEDDLFLANVGSMFDRATVSVAMAAEGRR